MSLLRAPGWRAKPAAMERHSRCDSADYATASALHERYLDDVFRYVSRRVPRREEAEDITAEVFATAFVQLPGFRGECPPRLWLLGIARRKTADAYRRRRVRRETLESELSPEESSTEAFCSAFAPAGEEPHAVLQREELCRSVRQLLQKLNEGQREALLLQHVEGLSIAEIAVVMGRSPAAANSLLQRGRAAFLRLGTGLFSEPEGQR